VRSLGGNHITVGGPVTLTLEICCRIFSHPVYFCDGATTPLLGYDAISAASIVIDTEARQIWSKDTVMYENAVLFTPSRSDTSPTAEPSTFVNSSDISLTITDTSPSTTAPSLTATVSPAFDSLELDPLAPSFVPASVVVYPSVYVSDPVVDDGMSWNNEFELSDETQLKVPVSSLDAKELELPDHVNDLFLQTVEGLELRLTIAIRSLHPPPI